MSPPSAPHLASVVAHLERAETELALAKVEAEQDQMWDRCEVLARVETIVDHTRRVSLTSSTAHYRAEKTAPIVEAALILQFDTLGHYGAGEAHLREEDPDAMRDELDELRRVLSRVVEAGTRVGWAEARLGQPTTESVEALRLATRELVERVGLLATRSTPDLEGV